MLSVNVGAAEFLAEAVAIDDNFAAAHAAGALLALLEGRVSDARAAVIRAQRAAAQASRREQQHVAAVVATVEGTPNRVRLIDEHLAEFPRDALLVNERVRAIAVSGHAVREQHRVSFLESLASGYADDWWFDSTLAFAYHEVDRFDESRRLSERSLVRCPTNAGASHSYAHVFFETADNEGGSRFLRDWMEHYDRRAGLRTHLAWHLALFELQRGDQQAAHDLLITEILGGANGGLALVDGASLLWRLDLEGGARRGNEWKALALAADLVGESGTGFSEVHAAMAYASCDDEGALRAIVDRLDVMERQGHAVSSAVAVPMVRAIAAVAGHDYATAITLLKPIESDLHRIGGSRAQWEIFEETMIACYLHLRRYEDALRLVRRRLQRRSAPRDLRWMQYASAQASVS
jgi:hypothetical protein